jgi:hypothetical protein
VRAYELEADLVRKTLLQQAMPVAFSGFLPVGEASSSRQNPSGIEARVSTTARALTR